MNIPRSISRTRKELNSQRCRCCTYYICKLAISLTLVACTTKPTGSVPGSPPFYRREIGMQRVYNLCRSHEVCNQNFWCHLQVIRLNVCIQSLRSSVNYGCHRPYRQSQQEDKHNCRAVGSSNSRASLTRPVHGEGWGLLPQKDKTVDPNCRRLSSQSCRDGGEVDRGTSNPGHREWHQIIILPLHAPFQDV